MREPRSMKVKDSDYSGDSLTVSHLSDTGKVHVMAHSWGEVSSASLNKTQVKRMIAWLDRWLAFKDANCTKDEGGKD